VVVFVAASALCAAAPTIELLIVARFVQGTGGLSLHQGALRSSTRSFIPMIAPGRSVRGQAWVRSRARLAPRRRVPDRRGVVARGLPDQSSAGGFCRRSRGSPCARDPGPDACRRPGSARRRARYAGHRRCVLCVDRGVRGPDTSGDCRVGRRPGRHSCLCRR
jgi:hypothetical protein